MLLQCQSRSSIVDKSEQIEKLYVLLSLQDVEFYCGFDW